MADSDGLLGSQEEEKPPQKQIDWGRYGLSEDTNANTKSEGGGAAFGHTDGYQSLGDENIQELYDEQQAQSQQQPWWKANFFIREPVLFGTWDGVFTSCMINIFGVVIFLRTGWMVGNAGIGLAVLIVLLTVIVAFIAALSVIGICERCHIESGGVYFLLSKVLGARMGATLGILYSFGQTVACALYCTGFGESVSQTLQWDEESNWAVRGVGIAMILVLLAINIAGVKWVIKFQLVLLAFLGIAMLDFTVGSFSHTDVANNFTGFGQGNFKANAGPSFQTGENFFTVFGVFFPTATGICAGINMSGDLKDPKKSIPTGTLSALGVSAALYLLFALLLGATCTREALQENYNIAEVVSLVGFLWLLGLCISSLSSCLGGLYGAPRILQRIADEDVIPIIKFLGHGRGPNREPVIAQLVVCFIAILFIFIGHVNELGPIVTMPFLITYAGASYAYFALAMGYDKIQEMRKRSEQDSLLSHVIDKNKLDGQDGYGSTIGRKDSLSEFKEDIKKAEKAFNVESQFQDSGGVGGGNRSDGYHTGPVQGSDKETLLADDRDPSQPFVPEIDRMPQSWYSRFINRWIALFGCFICLLIMFFIKWVYALVSITAYLVIYFYIGQANPGVKPGVADFSFFGWLKHMFQTVFRGPPPKSQMVVNSQSVTPNITTEQLTEDNDDFANRGRYHQAQINQTSIGEY